MKSFADAMSECPIVAILRGIRPAECVEIGTALVDAGITMLEVPLNSPGPLKSIEIMSQALGDRALIGAGTVLHATGVSEVARVGGRLVVSPNTDPRVIAEAKRLGMTSIPGFATPTEAFAALDAGADALKLFPAEASPPAVVRSLRAILPPATIVLAVGSITLGNMADYWNAGASGFGLGSALYKPGANAQDVGENARTLVSAVAALPAR